MKLVVDNKEAAPAPVARKREKTRGRYCRHGGEMIIDPETRLIQCGICDVWLDAFTGLEILTRRWHQQTEATKWAEYTHKELRDSIAKLKREERNTKARIRAAKKRLETLPTESNDGN